MPKLHRIAKARIAEFIRPSSLRRAIESLHRLFGAVQPRFYRAKGKHVFALGRIPKGSREITVFVAKFDENKGRFSSFARCRMVVGKTAVSMITATALPKKTIKVVGVVGRDGRSLRVFAKQKTGFNIFRLFLNEAIAVAKKNGLDAVFLTTPKKELKEYYKGFGFEFPGDGSLGMLLLPKKQ